MSPGKGSFCNHWVVCCRVCFSFLMTSAELGTPGRVGVQPWPQTLASPHQAVSVWGVQALILLGLLLFPKMDSPQVSPAPRCCPVLTPKNKEMPDLRKPAHTVFVCITESRHISKDFQCIPCPMGSPFLKPSNLAEG